MDIASGVARVSGLGEPLTYISPSFNTQPVEKIEAIQTNQYKPKFPSEDTSAKAETIQSSPKDKATYKPGDLVNLYA
ncbi:hypothetical protein EHQ58_01635 [Leptospira ognonensis]|uniref:Uncharacterized protein n=1 Tax=Leptospira ognonensis TaxID=2484945 RepID=A0A4V3JSB7_9LEPT|nr:hypothetical protein [Leptospira ognonensis]TGL63170.1 hypothetical protein EHQ58_01635 [Leptospira ognonensis]